MRSMSVSCTRYFAQSCQRSIHTTWLRTSEADLERAKQKLATLNEDPGNEVKLKLYSLFKQVRSNSFKLWNWFIICIN